MRRSPRLLIGLLVAGLSSSALAQPVMSPYAEEPAPPPQVQAPPPVPPPIVAPAPQPGCQYPNPNCQYPNQYQYNYGYAQPQPYYYQPPPRTFHEEMQPRYGLMVAGIVILGASWSINAATAYIADEWRLAVPVAGPF